MKKLNISKISCKLFLILFCIFCNSLLAQQPQIPEDILSYSVFIEVKDSNTGTGFFMQYGGYCYLVTARHVFFNHYVDKNRKIIYTPRDSIITIASYPRDPHKSETNILILDLHNKQWDIYTKYDSANDIAATQIGKIDSAFTKYHSFVTKVTPKSRIMIIDSSFSKSYNKVFIGNDVFIIGYPTSIGIQNIPQIDYLKPLLRKGAIAGKNEKQQSIILDCSVYPGNSGGPVFEYDLDYTYIPVQRRLYVIGIVNEFVPFTQEWFNKRHGNSYIEISNSGYSVVTPIDTIIELLKKY